MTLSGRVRMAITDFSAEQGHLVVDREHQRVPVVDYRDTSNVERRKQQLAVTRGELGHFAAHDPSGTIQPVDA